MENRKSPLCHHRAVKIFCYHKCDQNSEGSLIVKKKKIIVGLIILVAILAVAVYWFLSSSGDGAACAAGYTRAKPAPGNIATYYNFTGNVAVKESQRRRPIAPPRCAKSMWRKATWSPKGDALGAPVRWNAAFGGNRGRGDGGERLGGRGRGGRAVPWWKLWISTRWRSS